MDSDLAATKGGNKLFKHSGSKFRVYEEERSILDALPSDIRGTYQDIIKYHSQLLDLLAQE